MTDKANSIFVTDVLKQLSQYVDIKEEAYVRLLEKENSELKQALEDRENMIKLQGKTIARQGNKITLLEKGLEDKEKQMEELRKQNLVSSYGGDQYDFKVNVTDFATDSLNDINLLCIGLIELANYVGADGQYQVLCQVDVAATYIVLSSAVEFKGTHFQYIGKMTDFCDFWNTCIVPYVDDKSHASEITTNYDTMKNVVNKVPFKGRTPNDWRFDVCSARRNKETLVRAINIKARIVNSLIGK